MVVLTMGVILPTVQKAGIDLLWFGIFIVLVVEMAQITPPVGFNLFVLQGMTGREIGTIARAALPFFLLMVADGRAALRLPGARDLPAAADAALTAAAALSAPNRTRDMPPHFAHRPRACPSAIMARPPKVRARPCGGRRRRGRHEDRHGRPVDSPAAGNAQPGAARRAAGAAPAAATSPRKRQPRRLPLADAAVRELSARRPSRPRRCPARSSPAPSCKLTSGRLTFFVPENVGRARADAAGAHDRAAALRPVHGADR